MLGLSRPITTFRDRHPMRHGMARSDRGLCSEPRPRCNPQDTRLDHTNREMGVFELSMAFQKKASGFVHSPAFVLRFLGGWRWGGCSSIHTPQPSINSLLYHVVSHGVVAWRAGTRCLQRVYNTGTLVSILLLISSSSHTYYYILSVLSRAVVEGWLWPWWRKISATRVKQECMRSHGECQQASFSGCGEMAWSVCRQWTGHLKDGSESVSSLQCDGAKFQRLGASRR